LKDIENQLVTEQKTDDLYIKDMRGKCESDETRLTQEISSTGQKIDELKAELDEKIPVREEKTGIYNDKVAEAEQIQDRIGELDDSKSERDSEWTAVAEEHDRATYVIENAKQMLERGFGGAFLE
jgi:chromosome segregation ATPase